MSTCTTQYYLASCKTETEIVGITLDWSTDTRVAETASITDSQWNADDGITVSTPTVLGQVTSCIVSMGVQETAYNLTNTVTLSDTQVLQRKLLLGVTE